MFSTGAFNPTPMAFQFPGQQPTPSIYQSQFDGFNPQILPSFQQAQPPSRGQSVPAPARQYPPPSGHYAPGPASSSRRHGQYPPTVPSQHYEYRSSHTKKHRKQRSFSPSDATDQGLYSDKERRETLEDEHIRKNSDDLSRSESSADEIGNKDQQSQAIESASGDGSLGDTLGGGGEDERITGENEKRKSSSKKKKHYRHDQYENCNNLFQQQQQTGFYGNFQNELPPHMKVHRQPLYNGYNQAYKESVRRGDVYQKQSKRSSRLPPEIKQQLLPHEGEQQQQFPFASPQGYPQQPFGGIRPQFNPYQPYGPQPGFYAPVPAQPQAPFNTLPPWSHGGVMINPADQEIQRLRSHIHTLEGELQKLQKKLTKATLNNNEPSGQDEHPRSHRRSKRDGIGSPRQTPVIVELNSATGEAIRESSSKKHRHRTTSNTSSHQGQKLNQQDSTSIQRSGRVNGENAVGQDATSSAINTHNQQQIDSRERSRSNGNQITEPEDRQGKQSLTKNPREETAAAAIPANGRQGPNATLQQQQQPPQVPPPPPVPRPQIPNQNQQYLYQQGALPPQMRGPAPRLPAGGNIRYPGDQQQQRNIPNPNYNQSNNNELFDDNIDRRKQDEQNRSAEKILDAFERSYLNRGRSSTVPMKVKYIPEEMNSNPKRSTHHHRQRNTNNNNNNNRYRSTSRSSLSSTWSSSDRLSSRRFNQKTTTVFTGTFM